ncbi:MAG: hypothetical protein IJ515_04705 [Clostridia bacterium]|nr:hypothetical protein [Clostridia bacterium]
MTFADKERLLRLRDTFSLNFRLTNMYAQYLERYPELITGEMINELTADSDITAKEALVAILCEAFGLDDARGGEERRLIRDYITPSVRVLDAKKYTENPYYVNVARRAIAESGVREGGWELRWEYYPPYRAAICDDMVIREDFSEYAPIGFFAEGFRFPAVLEDGNEWMTLTPVDVDTCDEAINAARGRVITFGLGLGYYTYMVSEKRDVESVTVVERSDEVIRLFNKYVLPHFTHPEKVRIINEDAFLYAEKIMPMAKFNYAFVDTWRDASDGLAMYERMKALEHLSPDTKFDYWIENFLISRRRALRFAQLWDKYERMSEDAPKSYAEFIEELTK